MNLPNDRATPVDGRPSPLKRLKDFFHQRILPHTQPADVCVLLFSLLVAAMFFTLEQPFQWIAFWLFIKDPLFWFLMLLMPLVLILITEDRVGNHYNIRRTVGRFVQGLMTFLRDFMPYLICLVIYLNLADKVSLANPNDMDRTLIAIDQALFGVQISQWLEQLSNVWLDEWMYFTYQIFGWYPLTLSAFFLARGQRQPFRNLLLAYVMASFIGYLGYVTVPAVGPRYYLEYTVDLRGRFFASVEWAMKNSLYVPRDCFPSLHTANTLVCLGMAFRYRRGLFWCYLPFGLSTIAATVYLRYHYAIDLVAGALLAALVLYLAPLWNERWDAWTARIRSRSSQSSRD